jgi:hypothetical protein
MPDAPDAGWPPDAVPVVVSEWVPLPTGRAYAHPAARRSDAVCRKHDQSIDRARRFAEAWRSLRQARGDPVWLGEPGYLERLYAAGVIMPGKRAP